MPTNDGVQLVRGSGAEGGAEGGSRREFVPFACFLVLSGLGVARMGRLACVFRALLCQGRCARDWLQVWAACERICGCEQHKRLCFLAPALAEQWVSEERMETPVFRAGGSVRHRHRCCRRLGGGRWYRRRRWYR